MKTNQIARRGLFLAILAALACAGCAHVPSGGASEAGVKFGITPLFAVQKDVTGIKVDNQTIRAAKTDTVIQILTFQWTSYAKDVVLPNPKPKATP